MKRIKNGKNFALVHRPIQQQKYVHTSIQFSIVANATDFIAAAADAHTEKSSTSPFQRLNKIFFKFFLYSRAHTYIFFHFFALGFFSFPIFHFFFLSFGTFFLFKWKNIHVHVCAPTMFACICTVYVWRTSICVDVQHFFRDDDVNE